MNTLAKALLSATALGALLLALPGPAASQSPTTTTTGALAFGMDVSSIAAQSAAGVKPNYGTFWIGPWTLSSGWGGPDADMAAAKSAGVTPAIHFYYWGDDITPTCVENGCWSSLHNAQKDRAGWARLGSQLTDRLNAKMGGAPVVVFLESEFNKGGISTYEPFDGYMADMANKIHAGYPNAIVVLGYGNWDNSKWGNFDRAAAASDMVGLQAMRGSTKDSATAYDGVYDATLVGVRKLESLFPTKPIMLTDIALSSYPTATYTQKQADNLGKFFTGKQALKDAGVTAMIYRSWEDSPTMDLANYYGQAERHWGLAYSDGTQKAAGKVWVSGVKAERSGSAVTATTTTTTTTSGYSATFTTQSGSSVYWVQEKVVSSPAPAKVDIKVNGGSWQPLKLQSYGDWTASMTIAKGTPVVFRATAPDGQTATSSSQSWLGAATTTTTASTAFKATFTPKSVGSDWWVETAVSANQAVTKVEAKVGSGAWVVLDKQSWGTYAKSINAPNGSQVTFRATSSTGALSYSGATTWP